MNHMDKLMTITKAAELLDCSPSKIYALAQAGHLEMKKLGYRSTRVTEASVLQLMNDPALNKIPPVKSPTGEHRRLRAPEAAKYLGVTIHKLYHMRARGDGPPFVKIGHQVIYDTRELDAWLTGKKQHSISVREAG